MLGKRKMAHRFVGKAKPKEPVRSLDETGQRLEERGESIDKKIARLERELAGYKAKLKDAKGPAAASLKKRAMQALKKKKMYEKQRDQLANQQFNIDQQAFAMESVQDAREQTKTMQENAKAMKKGLKKVNVDKFEKMRDKVADTLMDVEEVTEVLSEPMETLDDVSLDSAELDAELEGLGDLEDYDFALEVEKDEKQAEDEKAFAALDLPEAPKREADMVDEFGLPAAPMEEKP